MIAPHHAPLSEEVVHDVIAKYPDKTGDTLSILEELQELHPLHYLPMDTLKMVADKKNIPLSTVYSVVTFYSFFNLRPQGRHCVMVCRGTACHTRGSKLLMDGILATAGSPDPEDDTGAAYTTEDYGLTVRTVACFGQCALAPVVAVDEDIHGHMSDIKMRRIVRAMMQEDKHHAHS